MIEAREEGAQGSLNGKTGTRASPLASEAGLSKTIHSFIQNIPCALSMSQCCGNPEENEMPSVFSKITGMNAANRTKHAKLNSTAA